MRDRVEMILLLEGNGFVRPQIRVAGSDGVHRMLFVACWRRSPKKTSPVNHDLDLSVFLRVREHCALSTEN